MAQLRQELIQFSLSIGQLPSPLVVNTETGHDAVDDQQHKFPTCKLPCERIQQLVLVLAVECSGIEDVLKRSVRIDVKAFSNLCNSFRSESTLGVYVGNFALAAAEFFGQLRDHGHCLRELGFPAAELAEDFADGHASEAAV